MSARVAPRTFVEVVRHRLLDNKSRSGRRSRRTTDPVQDSRARRVRSSFRLAAARTRDMAAAFLTKPGEPTLSGRPVEQQGERRSAFTRLAHVGLRGLEALFVAGLGRPTAPEVPAAQGVTGEANPTPQGLRAIKARHLAALGSGLPGQLARHEGLYRQLLEGGLSDREFEAMQGAQRVILDRLAQVRQGPDEATTEALEWVDRRMLFLFHSGITPTVNGLNLRAVRLAASGHFSTEAIRLWEQADWILRNAAAISPSADNVRYFTVLANSILERSVLPHYLQHGRTREADAIRARLSQLSH